MQIANIIHPLQWTGLGTAVLCGLIIGLERQLSQKPIGIRTSILICLGAYVFMAAGKILSPGFETSRIPAQIITGIGFIGAGVIMARGNNIIGVTSASVIWILAGVGIMIGLERYPAAICIAVLTVVILTGVHFLEKKFSSINYSFHRNTNKNSDSD